MSLSMYQASVPVYTRGFAVLSTLLRKGEAHVRNSGGDPAVLINARLAPDMMTLAEQVQHASDTAKLALERLTGVPSPRMDDTETSFSELQARIEKTVAYLNGFDTQQLEDSEERTIQLAWGDFKPSFKGGAYLLTFALPNFFFHVTTAYDILRHKGVKIGKLDYLGEYEG